jgi:peptidoglycan/xylan/chitin deacetylase (PgdA/CDA1 family)
MRTAFKSLLETALVSLGPAALSRRAFRRRSLVLAYHNILPSGEEPGADRSLHLPEAAFREQLDALEKHCDVVPLAELLEADDSTDRRRSRVAITFDDAYRGAVTTGLGELRRRGMPATLFVTPGALGGEGFWWDRVRTAGGAALGDGFRQEALERGRGLGEEVQAMATAAGLAFATVPPHARAVSEDELTAAAGWDGLHLGAHTWRHPNLTRLAGEELRDELGRPLAWLKARFPRAEPWLAYPYGLSNASVEAAAARAGYTTGLLVEGGWLPPGAAGAYRVPRLNVPAGLSQRGFIARISGLLG